MAKDELTGNMPTENLVTFFNEKNIPIGINSEELENAEKMTFSVFNG